jgi:hypothetical protein
MFSLIQAVLPSMVQDFTTSIKVMILFLLHNKSTTLGYCYEKAPYCAFADTLASFPYTSPPLSRNDQESNIGNKETIGLDNSKVIFTPRCVEPIAGLEPVQSQPWLPSPLAGLPRPLG